MSEPEVRPGGFDAFIFSLKGALAAVFALAFMKAFDLPGAAWAPVSAVLVVQPSLHPSLQASLFRVLANIIGALVGAVLVISIGASLFSLAVGLLVTGLFCHYAKLEDALRSAYVATVIIILTSESHVWYGCIDRLLAVMIGCFSAIGVTLLFDKFLYRYLVKLQRFNPTRANAE